MYVAVGSCIGMNSYNFSGSASLKKPAFTTPDPSTANNPVIFGCFDHMQILFVYADHCVAMLLCLAYVCSLQIAATSGSNDLSGPYSSRISECWKMTVIQMLKNSTVSSIVLDAQLGVFVLITICC